MSLFGSLLNPIGALVGGGGGGTSTGDIDTGIGNHKNTNYAQNTSTNYATNNTNTGTTNEVNILGTPTNVTLTDPGTVAASFEFATHAIDQSYAALDQSKNAYNDTQDALQNAYQQSLAFVGKQAAPESATTTNLTYAVLGVAVLFIYFMSAKK